MSLYTFLTEQVVALTNRLNAIDNNAKKIDELTAQDILDTNSKIHVSKNGDSESLRVGQIIDAVVNNTYNQILSIGEITNISNVVSIPAGAIAKINNTIYTTSSVTNITIPYAATGLVRTDILVFNTSNAIVREVGSETSGIAIRPNVPLNTVLVTEINVSDSSLSDPTYPIIGENFIEKIEKLESPITGTGSVNHLVTDKTASYIITGSVTEFTGLVFQDEARDSYSGKKYSFKNDTAVDVLFKHAVGIVQFDFPNALDFRLKPNETIEFLLKKRSGGLKLEFVGAIVVSEKPNFNFYQQGRVFSNLFGTNNSGKWLRIFPFAIAEYSDSTGQTDKDLVIPSYESAVFKVPTKCKIIQISKVLSSDLGMLIIKTTNNNGLTPIRLFHLEPTTDIFEHNAQNDTVINEGDYIHIFYKKVSNANPQSFYILNITFKPL